jgi:hypothetical protein
MKAILIATVIFLILLGSTKVQAKVDDVQEIDFQARISEMAKTHRILMDKMIAYVEFKHESINLLAEVAYWENWHTDKDKLTALWTMGVVMNRVESKQFPNTVKEILYQRGQYATTKYFYTKELPEECYEMARDVWENGVPEMPDNVLFQSQQPKLGRGHWKVLNGEYFAYGG